MTMNKFKVGDLVRWIDPGQHTMFGFLCIVTVYDKPTSNDIFEVYCFRTKTKYHTPASLLLRGHSNDSE